MCVHSTAQLYLTASCQQATAKYLPTILQHHAIMADRVKRQSTAFIQPASDVSDGHDEVWVDRIAIFCPYGRLTAHSAGLARVLLAPLKNPIYEEAKSAMDDRFAGEVVCCLRACGSLSIVALLENREVEVWRLVACGCAAASINPATANGTAIVEVVGDNARCQV